MLHISETSTPAPSFVPTAAAFGEPDPSQIRACLDRICASVRFSRAPRLRRLLRFAVEQTLAGRRDSLREYTLGVEVFDKSDAFDPRLDSIVRVEARRLRNKMAAYYEREGREDEVRIVFRPGEYGPQFLTRSAAPERSTVVLLASPDQALALRIHRDLTTMGYHVALSAPLADDEVTSGGVMLQVGSRA